MTKNLEAVLKRRVTPPLREVAEPSGEDGGCSRWCGQRIHAAKETHLKFWNTPTPIASGSPLKGAVASALLESVVLNKAGPRSISKDYYAAV